jgi:membrane-associated phospholipid phosphatase
MTEPRFVALPPRSEIANLALLSLALAAWFGLCYGGAAALAPFIPWRVSVALPVDASMPFVPVASALYLTIAPMMLLAPFVLRDLGSVLPLFVAFLLETTVAAAFFLLMPIDDVPVSCEADGAACAIFRFADALNLHHNNLPSLHVAFAWTLAFALSRRAAWPGTALLYFWAVAVSLSTMLTHQHFLADVVTGAALALVCWRIADRWGRRTDVLAAFDVELLALRNFGRFAQRHRRYAVIGLAILAASFPRWRRQRLSRVGFAFLQALDDLLDGDRPSDREPLEIADEMIASLESGAFANHELARLGASFRAELLAQGGREALDEALDLVRAMRNDRRRVLAQEVSTRDELVAIHRATFSNSVNLMMRAANSPLRAADVPLFIDALGWCSTVRDLREDLGQGLINIPADVFHPARLERPGVPLPVLLETRAVQDWLAQEKERARELLDGVDAQLLMLEHFRGAPLLRRFAESMRQYTE